MRASFKAIEVKVRQKYELAKSTIMKLMAIQAVISWPRPASPENIFVTVTARTEIFMKNCTEHFLPSLYIISDVQTTISC